MLLLHLCSALPILSCWHVQLQSVCWLLAPAGPRCVLLALLSSSLHARICALCLLC